MIKAVLAINACLLSITSVMNFNPNEATPMCLFPAILAVLNIIAIAFENLEANDE